MEGVKMWCKQQERMNSVSLVSTDQDGGFGIISWHTLTISKHWCSNCPSLYFNSISVFWGLLPGTYWTLSQSSNNLRLVSSDLQHNYKTLSQQRTFVKLWNKSLSRIATEICSDCVTVSCQYWPKSQSNVSDTLRNVLHEEIRCRWRQTEVQLITSQVFLINWPMSVIVTFALNAVNVV